MIYVQRPACDTRRGRRWRTWKARSSPAERGSGRGETPGRREERGERARVIRPYPRTAPRAKEEATRTAPARTLPSRLSPLLAGDRALRQDGSRTNCQECAPQLSEPACRREKSSFPLPRGSPPLPLHPQSAQPIPLSPVRLLSGVARDPCLRSPSPSPLPLPIPHLMLAPLAAFDNPFRRRGERQGATRGDATVRSRRRRLWQQRSATRYLIGSDNLIASRSLSLSLTPSLLSPSTRSGRELQQLQLVRLFSPRRCCICFPAYSAFRVSGSFLPGRITRAHQC